MEFTVSSGAQGFPRIYKYLDYYLEMTRFVQNLRKDKVSFFAQIKNLAEMV